MIVDSSALITVISREPGWRAYRDALRSGVGLSLSAGIYLETGLVIDSRGQAVLSDRLDELIDALGMQIVAVSSSQAHLARVAHQRYGRGSGSPARLNYGDCFSYALAKETGQPLLFKGNGFVHTDIRSALDAWP